MAELPTTPTHSISLAQSYLAASLSQSAAFQTWVGATGSSAEKIAAALEHVHELDIPAPTAGGESQSAAELAALRPYALICTDTERGQGGNVMHWDRVACGTTEAHGGLLIAFEENVAEEAAESDHAAREIFVRLANTVAAVIEEIMALSETAGCLSIQRAELKDVGRCKRSEQDAQGDYAGAVVRVEW